MIHLVNTNFFRELFGSELLFFFSFCHFLIIAMIRNWLMKIIELWFLYLQTNYLIV